MLVLPNNLKCLSSFTDDGAGARWAIGGVQVEDAGKGQYVAAATDCKTLVIVEGKAKKADEYPAVGALEGAPNGGTKGIIPAKLFAEVMADSAKKTKSCTRPILKTVAIQMSAPTGIYGAEGYDPGQAVLGWTNLEQHSTPVTKLIEGRFPPYQDIIPKKAPLARIALDPEYIIRLGEVCKNMKPLVDKECCRVEVDFYGSHKPCIFRFENPDMEQNVTVLIMPLVSDFENDGLLNETLLAADVETNKTLLASVNQLREESKQLEDALRQTRLELRAAREDAKMYRERAESVQS